MDSVDRFFFLKTLVRVCRRDDLKVLAWVLMGNHVHLVAMRHARRLGESMRDLLGPHAQFFNTRHERCGHLFQNRFYSRHCDTHEYLVHAIRYVHANPVRAGLVSHPADYHHSSYDWYARGVAPSWGALEPAQEGFASASESKGFFTSDGSDVDARVLDDYDERHAERGKPAAPTAHVREAREAASTLRELVVAVARGRGLTDAEIRSKTSRRVVAEARREFARMAIRDEGFRPLEVAQFLGLSHERVRQYLIAGDVRHAREE